MKIQELYKDERPREKILQHGADAMSNAELLAILLRSGTSESNVLEMSQRLLSDNQGKLRLLAGLSIDALCKTKGLGRVKAATLCAAFELGRRCLSENVCENIISNSASAVSIMIGKLGGRTHEECWVIFLNLSNRIISIDRISSGGMSSTVIDNKIISRMALEKRAHGVILFHNHPSGQALPSRSDINETEKLKKALATFDIALIDHIIIAAGSYYSFADESVSPLQSICEPGRWLSVGNM